jgi:hypothetical protein
MTTRASHRDREDAAETWSSVWLWFGFLGGPLAGLLNVMVDYPVVDRACLNQSPVALHVLTLLFLAIAVVAGLISWRWRERVGYQPSTAGGLLARSRFMANVGILTALTSVFAILLQWIPIFFIGACRGT